MGDLPLRSGGLDPSSNVVGFAVVEDGRPIHFQQFKFRPKEGYDESNVGPVLTVSLARIIEAIQPWDLDVLAVEKVSVQQNMDTVRKIAYFEAVCMIAGAELDIPVHQVRTTSARKQVLGKGSLSKDEVLMLTRTVYGSSLTADEADAVVLAHWAEKKARGIV